jgi:ABC-type transport system involved in multi-copper enzyme maturation permease subunit
MGIVFLLMLYFKEQKIPAVMFKGVLMTFFQMMLLAALAIFFSTFASPVVNFFLSFGIFLVGNMPSVTDSLTSNRSLIVRGAGDLVHYILPNFGNFNIQNSLIHPTVVITNPTSFLVDNMVYALIYSAVLLIGAILIFDRREV